MSNFHKSMPVALMAGLIASTALPASALEMTEIGQFKLGYGEGYAEMIRYHAPSESLLVTSSETGAIKHVSISTPSNMSRINPLDLDGGNLTVVAVHGDLVAASIKMKPADAPGTVNLFDTGGTLLATYETGALSDNVALSPDGRYLLTANESEPSDDYSVDP